MTDQDRAWAVRDRLKAHLLSDRTDEDFVTDLVEDFAAVRRDERRVIAEWLHAKGTNPNRNATWCAALLSAADLIERGEHADG